MKDAPLLLLVIGAVLIWTGLTGRLGTLLGAIFQPERMSVDA